MSEQSQMQNATAPVERRLAAMEAALHERGMKPGEFIEEFKHLAEEKWIPENGARVVAKAWTDPAFKQRLIENGRDAVVDLGIPMPPHHRHLVVLENTPTVHNVICCTLCSCTAFTVIGLPPDWYKDLEYRARVVRQSRTVLKEMGLPLPPEVEIRVWDTTADTRYIVLPEQPPETRGWAEEKLAAIVTKDSMIGVAHLNAPEAETMDGMHDLGGKQGFGPVRFEPGAPTFHEAWEKRANALYSLAVKLGIFNMDEYRHAIERMEPRHYLSASYYERSLTSLASICVEKGVVSRAELEERAGGSFPLSLPAAAGRSNVTERVRFKIGDRVTATSDHVPGHVRMPAYIRGKTGVVVGESPAYPFPDAHAHGVVAEDEPTYDVRFDTVDLWPNSADHAFVHVGIFQSYLTLA